MPAKRIATAMVPVTWCGGSYRQREWRLHRWRLVKGYRWSVHTHNTWHHKDGWAPTAEDARAAITELIGTPVTL